MSRIGFRRILVPVLALLAAISVQGKTDGRQLANKVFQREQQTIEYLKTQRPIVETYLQHFDDGEKPARGDLYFLGEWNVGVPSFDDKKHPANVTLSLIAGRNERSFGSILGLRYTAIPAELTEMFFVSTAYFTPENYLLVYEKDESLGGIPCAVFVVQPIPANAPGRVQGRLWVELSSASIVRIHARFTRALNPQEGGSEFDSWRWRTAAGYWVPYYLYSESTSANPAANLTQLRMRMTVHVWDYDRTADRDAAGRVRQNPSPELQQRSYLDNNKPAPEAKIIRWLDGNGLVAAHGSVDEAVCKVARALMRTSALPTRPISCRVLMTSPLESFTVGQTIAVSRGLLDLVPDEPALAAVIAHEVAHVLLGHTDPPPVDASGNIFASGSVPAALRFHRNAAQETAARSLARQLIAKSPYAGTLDRLLEFAGAIEQRKGRIRNVFRARFGGDIAAELVALAAMVRTTENISPGALALGSRIEFDPVTNRISFATKYRGIPSRTAPFGVAAKIPWIAGYPLVGDNDSANTTAIGQPK
jgi:hypothetical protein